MYCSYSLEVPPWRNKKPSYTSTIVLLNPDVPCLANSVVPDQLLLQKPTDLDLHCSPGSTLFVIKCVNFNKYPQSRNLIG